MTLADTTPLLQIDDEYAHKLNDATKNYLHSIENIEATDEYLIKFQAAIDQDKLAQYDLKKHYTRFHTIKIAANANEIIAVLADPDILYVELDQDITVLADVVPYGVEQTNAPSVWNSTNGSDVNVAILDTGIAAHLDLAIAGGTSIVSANYSDLHGHGTSIAGVLAAKLNDDGLVGVAPEANLYAVKIMNYSTGSLSDAIEGVQWSIDNNMSIVSMSFGMESYSQIFKEVLQEAYDEGILLVAAAGNDGGNVIHPAAYTDVIAVGAVDNNSERASFSNSGFELELVAAGVSVNTTTLDNNYTVLTGSSLAAAHVSGVAALLKAHNTSLTNEQIRAKLRNDALDLGEQGKDDYYGYGLVQVNIETTNYTYFNESYFYEIFNITDYGEENESYLFWLNGTSTTDDVNFTEGYYLVNITIEAQVRSYVYNVSENGTIFILAGTIEYTDDFVETELAATRYDGVAWQDGGLNISLTIEEGPMSNVHAECYDNTSTSNFYELCYFRTSSVRADCDDNPGAPQIRCTTGDIRTQCIIEEPGIEHSLDTSTPKQTPMIAHYWYNSADCSSGGGQSPEENYYVIDKKRYYCYDDTLAIYQGYNGNAWFDYGSLQCAGNDVCDTTREYLEYTSPTTSMQPCVLPCTGRVEVNVLDSEGSGMNGSYVYLNDVLNGTTDEIGQKIMSPITCDIEQNISVYCYNNQSRLCGIKKTTIDFLNDEDSLFFDCNLCLNDNNLWANINDIDVSGVGWLDIMVTITVHSENIEASNVNVTVMVEDKTTGLISNVESDLIPTVSNSEDYNVIINVGSAPTDYLHVYIDPNNSVSEPKTDNYVLVPVVRQKLVANLSVNTGYSIVDEAIREYLRFYVDDTSQDTASVVVSIGKNTTEVINYNDETLDQSTFWGRRWGLLSGQVYVDDRSLTMPYSGLVGSFVPSSNNQMIFIYGNRMEGTIAALKEFISAREVFFSISEISGSQTFRNRKLITLDKYDTNALAVFDLMHNNESQPYFGQDTAEFANVVTDILNNNNFELSIKKVKTLNTTSYGESTILRLQHANTDYSGGFRDAVVENPQPVVLAHGIHSDLSTWNDFGEEIAQAGRDAWVIEMYGGFTTDYCLFYECVNYSFNDLTEHYWPTLVAGVQQYSEQDNLSYVGFDLGCTVALESLENVSDGQNNVGYYFSQESGTFEYVDLSADPIDTFIGLGCIGDYGKTNGTDFIGEEVEYLPPIPEFFNQSYPYVRNFFGQHPDGGTAQLLMALFYITNLQPANAWNILFYLNYPVVENRISINIYDDIYQWINSAQEPNLGQGIILNNALIIESNITNQNPFTIRRIRIFGRPLFLFIPKPAELGTDQVLKTMDQTQICSNIISNNKYYVSFNDIPHFTQLITFGLPSLGIADKGSVQGLVIDYLEDGNIEENGDYKLLDCN